MLVIDRKMCESWIQPGLMLTIILSIGVLILLSFNNSTASDDSEEEVDWLGYTERDCRGEAQAFSAIRENLYDALDATLVSYHPASEPEECTNLEVVVCYGTRLDLDDLNLALDAASITRPYYVTNRNYTVSFGVLRDKTISCLKKLGLQNHNIPVKLSSDYDGVTSAKFDRDFGANGAIIIYVPGIKEQADLANANFYDVFVQTIIHEWVHATGEYTEYANDPFRREVYEENYALRMAFNRHISWLNVNPPIYRGRTDAELDHIISETLQLSEDDIDRYNDLVALANQRGLTHAEQEEYDKLREKLKVDFLKSSLPNALDYDKTQDRARPCTP